MTDTGTPVISVVIPLYNKVKYIKRALDSVLAQTYQDFEVIVVNDGSTDGSQKIVEQYTDPRIRLINQENAGVSAARNRGISEARADLIAFLDADDEWLPEHLRTILRLREKYPECGAYATAYDEIVDQSGRRRAKRFPDIPPPPWEGIIPNYFRSAPVWSSAVAVPKRVFYSVGFFPSGESHGEDLDMWCRIALKYPIAFSTQIGAVYHRESENSVLKSGLPGCCSEHALRKTILSALELKNLPSGVAPADLAEHLRSSLIRRAILCLHKGDYARAKEYLSELSNPHLRIVIKRWDKWVLLSHLPSAIISLLWQLRRLRYKRDKVIHPELRVTVKKNI